MKRTIATLVLLCVLASAVPAQSSWRMTEADRTWWLARSVEQRGYFLIGYILSSWVWARTLYIADQDNHGAMSEDYYVAYQRLGPAGSYTWDQMEPLITQFYREYPRTNLTVFQVIHTLFTVVQQPSSRGDF